MKGLGGFGDMSKMMAAARDMQAKVEEMQSGLEKLEVEGNAGAGMVKATANAKGELLRLAIDPSLFRAEDREVVEDLIVAAVRDAQTRATDAAKAEAEKMAASFGLPPGMKLPF
ncbi:YbaB/EbfC family nucleoid-associated protein [Paracoccus sp. S-4012]|uniref:YbaB/EbfC family nucleoid-associated protein n=1 Tax=Paracoccus sp. S-4012 TaxID=2665648 RepID=UPI0012B0BFAF|nr:YbaB/EbfC family nucleoid-associated protein [Paracoccus sp. S-4012]MRX50456.1 YbaB/EbfC family nucleoid-associated protein [Paracoccus sp. S-4012]